MRRRTRSSGGSGCGHVAALPHGAEQLVQVLARSARQAGAGEPSGAVALALAWPLHAGRMPRRSAAPPGWRASPCGAGPGRSGRTVKRAGAAGVRCAPCGRRPGGPRPPEPICRRSQRLWPVRGRRPGPCAQRGRGARLTCLAALPPAGPRAAGTGRCERWSRMLRVRPMRLQGSRLVPAALR